MIWGKIAIALWSFEVVIHLAAGMSLIALSPPTHWEIAGASALLVAIIVMNSLGQREDA